MNADNPYQPPATNVDITANKSEDVWAFVEPQKMSAGRGLGWIADGFRFFGRDPGIWVVITIIYLIILMLSSLIPFATNILQPMLAGGLMIGVHQQDNGQPLEIKHLFDGFENAAGKLATLGALLIGLIILMYIGVAILGIAAAIIASIAEQKGNLSPIVIIITLIVGIPILSTALLVTMSVSWFGPPLVILHDLSVGEAFKMSLLGLKRNILPIIIFTFFFMLLFIAATVFTLTLGLLVIIPVMMGASYASWKDVFTRANVY